MPGELLGFEDVRALVASKKPPLTACVVELRDGVEHRAASVVYDGVNASEPGARDPARPLA